VLVLDMIEILPPLRNYKYDTRRIVPMKGYIENSVSLRSCIRNANIQPLRRWEVTMWLYPRLSCPNRSFSTELDDADIDA
jgi:hypothetical protein